jgi:hypothetical protein
MDLLPSRRRSSLRAGTKEEQLNRRAKGVFSKKKKKEQEEEEEQKASEASCKIEGA